MTFLDYAARAQRRVSVDVSAHKTTVLPGGILPSTFLFCLCGRRKLPPARGRHCGGEEARYARLILDIRLQWHHQGAYLPWNHLWLSMWRSYAVRPTLHSPSGGFVYGDSGPRTSKIRIFLNSRVLQKYDVRGPRFSEGTTNKGISHCVVSQWIMKSRCSRSVGRIWAPEWCSPDPSLRLQILHFASRSFTPPAAAFRMTNNGFVQDECSVPDPSLPLRMTKKMSR